MLSHFLDEDRLHLPAPSVDQLFKIVLSLVIIVTVNGYNRASLTWLLGCSPSTFGIFIFPEFGSKMLRKYHLYFHISKYYVNTYFKWIPHPCQWLLALFGCLVELFLYFLLNVPLHTVSESCKATCFKAYHTEKWRCCVWLFLSRQYTGFNLSSVLISVLSAFFAETCTVILTGTMMQFWIYMKSGVYIYTFKNMIQASGFHISWQNLFYSIPSDHWNPSRSTPM